jgi:hypothetical protein
MCASLTWTDFTITHWKDDSWLKSAPNQVCFIAPWLMSHHAACFPLADSLARCGPSWMLSRAFSREKVSAGHQARARLTRGGSCGEFCLRQTLKTDMLIPSRGTPWLSPSTVRLNPSLFSGQQDEDLFVYDGQLGRLLLNKISGLLCNLIHEFMLSHLPKRLEKYWLI